MTFFMAHADRKDFITSEWTLQECEVKTYRMAADVFVMVVSVMVHKIRKDIESFKSCFYNNTVVQPP